jgi:nucleolar GTP-binding protein
MQSITALAHLKCVVVFLVDISESCGHGIEDQLNLYNSLKPLFAGKPTVIALNKTDLVTFENLEQEQKNLIENFQQQNQERVFL